MRTADLRNKILSILNYFRSLEKQLTGLCPDNPNNPDNPDKPNNYIYMYVLMFR